MFCDYDTSRGFCWTEGLGCFKGVATRKVEVVYNEVEKDSLNLCEDCYKRLRVLVRRQGYKLVSNKIGE